MRDRPRTQANNVPDHARTSPRPGRIEHDEVGPPRESVQRLLQPRCDESRPGHVLRRLTGGAPVEFNAGHLRPLVRERSCEEANAAVEVEGGLPRPRRQPADDGVHEDVGGTRVHLPETPCGDAETAAGRLFGDGGRPLDRPAVHEEPRSSGGRHDAADFASGIGGEKGEFLEVHPGRSDRAPRQRDRHHVV